MITPAHCSPSCLSRLHRGGIAGARSLLSRWRQRACLLWALSFAVASSGRAGTADSPDPVFLPPSPSNGYGYRAPVKATADGKVLVGQFPFGLQRLDSNGQVDSSFTLDSTEQIVAQLAEVLPDGRIYLAAYFFPDPNTLIARLVRLLPNGARDPSFAGGTGVRFESASGEGNPWFSALRVLTNGEIVVVGRFAQAGGASARDVVRLSSHGTVDVSFVPWARSSYGVLHADVQPDGKIVASGYFARAGLEPLRLVRFNLDGSLDLSFDPGAGPDSEPGRVLAQPDGRILISGNFRWVSGWARPHLARLRSDGSVDPSFDPGDGAGSGRFSTPSANPVLLLPNGKILAIGPFQSYDTYPRRFLVRLNPDGTLDTSFGPGFGGDQPVDALDVLPDGRIAVVGQFSAIAGRAYPGLALLQGGEPSSAAPELSLSSAVSVIEGHPVKLTAAVRGSPPPVLQWEKDGVDIPGATGSRYTFPVVTSADRGRYRLRASNSSGSAMSGELVLTVSPVSPTPGTLDPTFRPLLGRPFYYTTAQQSSGSVLAVNATPATGAKPSSWLIRFGADGSIDPAFQPGPNPEIERGSILAVDGSNRIIVGGLATAESPSGLLRLLPDGAPDPTFVPDSSVHLARPNAIIRSVAVSGSTLDVHGYFEGATAEYTTRLFRLNEDGALAPDFDADRLCLHGVEGLPMLRLGDGSLLVPGVLYSDLECRGAVAIAHLARFQPDGHLDTNFTDQPSDTPQSIVSQADGKILIGGRFARIGLYPQPSLARLNPNGTRDPGFTSAIDLTRPLEPDDDDDDDDVDYEHTTVRSVVNAIALEPDGGFYIAGDFSTVDGVARPGLARLLADGLLDLRFQPESIGFQSDGNTLPELKQIHRQPDGNLIISGRFTEYAGAQRLGIARVFGLGSAQPIALADAALEHAVREVLNLPTGTLTTHDLGRLTTLDLSHRGATGLGGLQYAMNLRTLILDGNPVTDLSALRGLPGLVTISILGHAHVDLAPLLSLPGLRYVCVESTLLIDNNAAVIASLRSAGITVFALSTTPPLAAQLERLQIHHVTQAVRPGSRSAGFAPVFESGLVLDWPSEAGRTYTIQISADLSTWRDVGLAPFRGTGTPLRAELTAPLGGIGFYRFYSTP
jgi:uncharacterized delta-60 repeat protein